MAKKKQPKVSVIDNQIRDHITDAIHHPNPTRIFEIGEEVIHGNHEHTVIIATYADNTVYRVQDSGIRTVGSRQEEYIQDCACYWNELFKKDSFRSNSKFATDERYDIRFYNTDIYSLLLKAHGGVNFNPPYQRDLVWTYEQKIQLLESIFNNIDIGKFVFVKLDYNTADFDWSKRIFYEILDGKQRLTTIMDFYNDRFPYYGIYYSKLSPKDRYTFDGFGIAYGEINDPKDINKIYQYFIRLNTFGKPIDQDHINRVKALCHDINVYTIKNNPFSLGISYTPIRTTIKAGSFEIITLGRGYSGYIFQNPISKYWHVAELTSGALVGHGQTREEAINLVRNDVETGDPNIMAEQVAQAIKEYHNSPYLEIIPPEELFKRLAKNR